MAQTLSTFNELITTLHRKKDLTKGRFDVIFDADDRKVIIEVPMKQNLVDDELKILMGGSAKKPLCGITVHGVEAMSLRLVMDVDKVFGRTHERIVGGGRLRITIDKDSSVAMFTMKTRLAVDGLLKILAMPGIIVMGATSDEAE